MSKNDALRSRSRRRLLLWVAPGCALGVVGVGCGKRRAFSCDDVGQLTPEQLEMRARVKYTDRAPKVELQCERCTQFVVAEDGACGQCKVMPGPTHPHGYCTLFAAG